MNEIPEIQRPIDPLTTRVLEWFVDRRAAFELFSELVSGNRDEVVLAVDGPQGIGKSWLLENLHHFLAHAEQGPHIPAALIDFRRRNFFDELSFWLTILQVLGNQFFPRFVEKYRNATQLKVVHHLKTSGGKGGVTIGDNARIYGEVAGRDIIKDVQFNTEVSRDLILQWSAQLSDAFLEDLARLGRSAILFDSYDLAPATVMNWIRNHLLPALGEKRLPGLRIALATHQRVEFHTSWEGLVARLTLEGLPAEEVRLYLTQKRDLVIGDEVIRLILELTRGKPDLVAIFADDPKALPQGADRDRLMEILLRGVLKNATPSTRETLQTIAVPEWFDIPLMRALLPPEPTVDQRWEAISKYSFIEPRQAERWQIAPGARQALLGTWSERPDQLSRIHETSASYFENRTQKAPDAAVEMEMAKQAVGHILVVDEQEGCKRLQELFTQYETAHLLGACEELLRRAETVSNLAPLTQNWLVFLRGRLHLADGKWETAATLLNYLRQSVDAASELYMLIGVALAGCALGQNEWARAIELCQGIPEYFNLRNEPARAAQVLLLMGKAYTEQARALGGPIEITPSSPGARGWLLAIPRLLVALPFILYARLVRHWHSLPPVHLGLNFRNWTFMRLLLSARVCYHAAEAAFTQAGLADRQISVWHNLAQTDYLLGRWADASAGYKKLLQTPGAAEGTYLRACVLADYAETALAMDERQSAVAHLSESSRLFARYEDKGRQAEVEANLGLLYLAMGDEQQRQDGIALLIQSTQSLSRNGDLQAASRIAADLEDRLQRGEVTGNLVKDVQKVAAGTPSRLYFPRVQDQTAAWLELLVSTALVLALLAGLTRLGLAIPNNTMRVIWQNLVSPGFWGKLIGWLLAFVVGFTLVTGITGFILVLRSTRRAPMPEHLDRIFTNHQAIHRMKPRPQSGQQETQQSIAWNEIRAIVSIERSLWRAPIPLLSQLRVFGPQGAINIPATMLRYDALKRDIESHLAQAGAEPVRRPRDLHILRSRLGVFFLTAPVFLALGSLVVWNMVELPISVAAAAIIGPGLIWLGMLGLVVPPYYWLVVYPLWTQYQSAPRSRLPWWLGGLGMILVVFVFYMIIAQPYFPILEWLNATVHPLGFLLLLACLLWIITARDWDEEPLRRGKPVYPAWVRTATGAMLVIALALTGYFANQASGYTHILPMIAHLYRGETQVAIDRCTELLDSDRQLASAYNFRALAYMKLDQPELAIRDLNDLVNGAGVKSTHYTWNRARAYHQAGQDTLACADTATALAAQSWRLSLDRQILACQARIDWSCSPVEEVDTFCVSLLVEAVGAGN